MDSIAPKATQCLANVIPLPVKTATPHPEWCRTHDNESNVCLGPNITLDLAADNRHNWLIDWANVGMGYCPEEGVDVFIDLPGMGAAYMTAEDAKRLGTALLAMHATAQRGGAR